ncbi:MAG: OadG family protein [Eubacteriales bacterium]|nr:OadG family protein [Eubacteriales bacterium]
MKQNMKRVWLVLCMVACLFSLTACAGKADDGGVEPLDPQIASQVSTSTEQYLSMITSVTGEEAATAEAELKKQKQTAMAEAVAAWMNVEKDTGSLVQVVASDAEATEDGGYSCTVNAQFEQRAVEFKAFYEVQDNYLVPVSFSIAPEYTTGENMAKAAMNTLMGMGTVFCVLIFISLLISCFKFISVFENKMKAKNAPAAPAPAAAPVVAAPAEEEELADDLELVAVITAAIAASEGTSADGLVVRSIKRAPGAKWKRA